jgi:hypothetical protein
MTTQSSHRRATKERRPPSGVWLIVAAVVVVLAAVGAVVLWIANRDGSSAVDDGSRGQGVAHVHGLGINPADRSLIIATHYGSFRIASGSDTAERIGDSQQDTMGFTVVGPDHFFGSGHPDDEGRRAGRPTRLGLIESTDGGETWSIQSQGGEADFHALVFAHETVYGWDASSGRLLVSTDRRTWDHRSTVDLFSFAVDPDDADHLVATSPDGLIDSTDGGQTWTSVDGPPVVLLSWHDGAGLWGVAAGGAVWHDADEQWQRASSLPGQPQALLATEDALYAAAHDADDVTGIYRSTDDGDSWQLHYRDG